MTPDTNWYHDFDVVFDSEVITVVAKLGDVEQTFTMQRYADTRFGDENGYAYGACVPNPFDFSEYPIGFNGPVDGTKTRMYVISGISSLEIEVLGGTQDTPAVWEKVGSGGSEPEPSGEKLFDGNVTTVEGSDFSMYEFSPMVALNYSSIIVEFDGTRYTLQDYKGGANWYAFGTEVNYPFDEYPFGLVFGDNGNQGLATYIFTESAGTYSLKIWANSEEGEMPVPVDPLG